ncbi:MAG: MBL fold metallo-hydrolase [Desulfofustis sp.]|nr:MBL fold metallo-hydrolase [Desulfofustis sp.]
MTRSDTKRRRSTIKVIDTRYIRRNLAASHLLIEEGAALFVDTGPAPAVDYLLAGLAEEQLTPNDVRYIVLTHIHLDHAGGAGELMRRCPRATLLVHPKGAGHMIDPEKLITASIDIYGAELFKKLYGTITAIDKDRVVAVEDGYLLSFHGRTLQFFDTPGHARHHLSIWDRAGNGIFTGDTLGLALPELQIPEMPPFLMPTTSPAAFDPDALEQSIKRLMSLRPAILYLTHFGPVQADRHSVDRLIELIRRHADLGRPPQRPEPASLTAPIHDLLFASYLDYCREYGGIPIDTARFDELLAGDVELNAQGVAIWSARQ